MILKMYCIYDRKTEIHHPPNMAHNTGHALRVFTEIFATPNQVFGKYPEDFQIFEVGSFDDQSGMLTALKTPHLICSGTELMTSKTSTPGDPNVDDNPKA